MKPDKVATYHSNDGVDLVPARTRLLFAAWIHHGPGFPEKVEYRIGPSKCGQFDVLWIKSDWDPESPTSAASWVQRHQMRGKALHLHLIKSLFGAQKICEAAATPNFSEVAGTTKALLSGVEVWKVADEVFGASAT